MNGHAQRAALQVPASLRLYALVTRAISPLAPMLLGWRARQGKEDAQRLGERLGRPSRARPAGQLVWLHGVSVGEGLSLLPLLGSILAARPKVGVLVTTGTRASADLLAERLPAGVIHQYAPVDTPAAVAAFLAHWRPMLGVFVESELWPNLLLAAQAGGVRLALVSARMSSDSARAWRRWPRAARRLLGAFDLILARDSAGAALLRALGAQVQGVADLKFGAPPLPADRAEIARLVPSLAERFVILAASTHPGEEARVLSAFARVRGSGAASARLIIAPRHVDRGEAVAGLARAAGFTVGRRTLGESPADSDVYVADSLGELGLWYRLANLAIVGGSLVEGVGGHNPLEPARLGRPFVAGAHVESWPIYAELAVEKATLVLSDGGDLARCLDRAIGEADAFTAMAERARAFVRARDRESHAAADQVLELIKP